MDGNEVTDDSVDNGVGEANPFSQENFNEISFIMQARIYDTLMALLKETSPDTARDLLQAHSNGLILGPSPSMVGRFLTDEANSPETE